MKNLVILGAGTAGTTVANTLRRKLPADWRIRVVDPDAEHLFQPDLIFLPFGMQTAEKMVRPRRRTLRPEVEWMQQAVTQIDPDRRQVILDTEERIDYDLLVIASGSQIRPEETPGLLGEHWQKKIFDYYTLDGALALRDALARFAGGRLVVNVVEMPIKCPVAPLEFAFLADHYFARRGLRDEVEIVYATPLDAAFTKPIAARHLGSLLDKKRILIEPEFNTASVDGEKGELVSWDKRKVDFDLLVTIPTHMGAPFVEASGLGDDLGFVPTDPHTLVAVGHDNIFVLGDATNLPTSKAGSVAHFQAEIVVENILRSVAGKSPLPGFDGHANCFIESGYGKAMLIDFNYETEPLPGVYPVPGLGPMSLLKESRLNHLGKLAFRWIYWNALLPGYKIPVPNQMSMVGKRIPPKTRKGEAHAVS